MANPRFAWGIDIGNRALKAVKLVRDNDSLRLEDIDVIEHEQVLSNSGDNREALIQTALATFAQRHPVKGGVVAIGVSGQASFARFIKLPPVEESKIPEIVRFEAVQQIPFPLEDVEWSYQLFRQPDNPDVEVGIFAMRKELVNQQIKHFTDMDMNVQAVQMNPLAVYNAMYYDTRVQDGTTMILDLGAENADLIIADGESVWLRSISIGGNNFTEALVKSFKLSFAKAEELKRNAQTSKYARQIFQAMRPIFADLVAEIQRSIGFYSSVHRDSRIKKIIALGNTFRLPTLQKYLQQNLQIDVERLDGFGAGAPEDGRVAAIMNENLASMASAYGLALQAMGQGKITSSLLPRNIQVEKIWKEKTKWFAGAAAILLAAAGLKFGVSYTHNQQFESKEEVRKEVDGTLNVAKFLDSKWTEIETSGGAAKQTIQNVISMAQYRDMWADIWLDITRALPEQTGSAPDKIKSTPRNQRQQIFIDGAYSQYHADMDRILKMTPEEFKELAKGLTPQSSGPSSGLTPVAPGSGEMAPVRRPAMVDPNTGAPAPATADEGGAGAGSGRRGYLLAMNVTSPDKVASELVEAKLVKQLTAQLSESNAFKKKPYFIARAMVTSAGKIGEDETKRNALKQAWDAKRQAKEKVRQAFEGTGLGGAGVAPDRGAPPPIDPRTGRPIYSRPLLGGGAGGEPGTPDEKAAEAEAYKDPLFPNETVLEDWQITVLMAIVLDPQKQETPNKPEGEQTEPKPEPGDSQTAAPRPADSTFVAR